MNRGSISYSSFTQSIHEYQCLRFERPPLLLRRGRATRQILAAAATARFWGYPFARTKWLISRDMHARFPALVVGVGPRGMAGFDGVGMLNGCMNMCICRYFIMRVQ